MTKINFITRKLSAKFIYGLTASGNYVDTIICYPGWKPFYNHSLIIRSTDKNLLVFTVNKEDNSEIETDSLKNY